ncbi:hypothetical protein CDAR_416201 [Caerostris darwini]|uniref:Uncharacterized protein n=1 Tax=Caerostris darwini TaxID=1538125 RepID=A0AAV4W4K1_9ARAC|nr:hypothetical protein CDAR_416201 [Caerostris darwini]
MSAFVEPVNSLQESEAASKNARPHTSPEEVKQCLGNLHSVGDAPKIDATLAWSHPHAPRQLPNPSCCFGYDCQQHSAFLTGNRTARKKSPPPMGLVCGSRGPSLHQQQRDAEERKIFLSGPLVRNGLSNRLLYLKWLVGKGPDT